MTKKLKIKSDNGYPELEIQTGSIYLSIPLQIRGVKAGKILREFDGINFEPKRPEIEEDSAHQLLIDRLDELLDSFRLGLPTPNTKRVLYSKLFRDVAELIEQNRKSEYVGG